MKTRLPLVLLLASPLACKPVNAAPAAAASTAAAPSAAGDPAPVKLPFPGASGNVGMDYIAYDGAHHRVWIPAGNTASVYVLEVPADTFTRIEGFPTKEVEREGKKRTVGPSSATVGDGVVFVGNRADSSICSVDATSLKKGACVTLDSSPDGLQYVASTKEVWVTTPRDQSIRVLDAAKLSQKAKIPLEGGPEGFAVDDARGFFYTNLEDKDRTLQIDLKTHKVSATWKPACGEEGPRGLALDHTLNALFVACTDHVASLDAGHNGAFLSSIPVGAGVDNIDYVESRHELVVAAGKAARLIIATVQAPGILTARTTVTTVAGARNAVGTESGTAYAIDSAEGGMLKIPAKPLGALPN